MIATILILLALGGGVSAIAETSLPGDVLYPIKVNVNEEVRAGLAFSNEADARFDIRRAERRLEEAHKLALKGEFNAEAKSKIEASFNSHIKEAEDEIEEEWKKDKNKAKILLEELRLMLEVKSRGLDDAEAKGELSSENKANLMSLGDVVSIQATNSATFRNEIDGENDDEDDNDMDDSGDKDDENENDFEGSVKVEVKI